MNDTELQFASWLGDGEPSPETEQLTDALDALYAEEPDEAIILKAQSELDKALENVLPPLVYYELLENTPVGNVWVGVNQNGAVIGIEYDMSEDDFLKFLSKSGQVRFRRSEVETADALREVTAYLEGKSEELNLAPDMSRLTEFQRTVLQAALDVPRGQVRTYSEIAKIIGNPKAVRAVGQALRRNPIPILIPCHRVIASDGTLGGYAGKLGDPRKIKLLKLEGVMLA